MIQRALFLVVAASLGLPSTALAWGTKRTHETLADLAAKRANADGRLSRYLYEQFGLSGGLEERLAIQLGFVVEQVRGNSAIVRIHTTEDEAGVLVPHSYPVRLRRAEGGTWQIYDY